MPKNNIHYTTDIAHCGGEDCDIRDKCMRYQLYLMWAKRPYKFAPFIEYPAYDGTNKTCETFRPIEP